MAQNLIRYYVLLRADHDRVKSFYQKRDTDSLGKFIASQVFDREVERPPFSIRSLPSLDVSTAAERSEVLDGLDRLVVALDVTGDSEHSSESVVDHIIRAAANKAGFFAGSSPDITIGSTDHWCVGEALDPIFSDRTAAERTVGIDYLRAQTGTDGAGVNVVIVDQGLNPQELGASYITGWSVGNSHPGSPPQIPGSIRPPHGMMIANNVLKVAPKARLFDLPMVPTQISNIQTFLSYANAAYIQMISDIHLWQLASTFPGPWILVNPWGILNRKTEYPLGHYTQNPASPFNVDVANAVTQNMDVVFAAGNCGQFCPDIRCGGRDRGPSRSIWGANSLSHVLSVGAVRADDMWLGYSSQGPGQPQLCSAKPDFCATSQFCEDGDAFNINTGTSAACGLTAGAVAALRSRWTPAVVSPQRLQQILNQTARKPTSVPWSNRLTHRLGNGILDLRAAFDTLQSQFP
jgi:subtilisin family serine protease